MKQVKSVANQSHFNLQTIVKKLDSVLRQPFCTISFPMLEEAKHQAKKKPKPPVAAKPAASKKALKPKRQTSRSPAPSLHKPLVPQTTMSKRNTSGAVGTFTSIHNQDEFEKILFVLRACEKNGGRSFTNVLHVEPSKHGSRLIATDGKRMHVAEIKAKIKPGDYKPIVTKDVIRLGEPIRNVQFPKWERVVPTDTVRCGHINLEKTASGNAMLASFVKQSGERVNQDYLGSLTKKRWLICRQKEKNRAVLLKEIDAKMETYAVIMPLVA